MKYLSILAVPALLLCGSCTTTKHEVVHTVETKPIVVEININIKIDKELDSFFDDLDDAAAAIQ